MEDDKLIIKPKKIKGEDGHKIFSIRLRDDIIAQLEVISSETGYSRNEIITKLLVFALEKCVVEKE